MRRLALESLKRARFGGVVRGGALAAMLLGPTACVSPPDGGAPAQSPAAGAPTASARPAPYDGRVLFEGLFFGIGPASSIVPRSHELPRIESAADREAVIAALQKEMDQLRRRGNSAAATQKLSSLVESLMAGGESADAVVDDLNRITDAVRRDGLPPQALAVVRKIEDRFLDQDPAFFDDFAAKVQSGDRSQVIAALRQGQTLLAATVNPYAVDDAALINPNLPPPQGGTVAINTNVATNSQAVANAWVAANLLVAINALVAANVAVASTVVLAAFVLRPVGGTCDDLGCMSPSQDPLRLELITDHIVSRLAPAL
jgi:SdpC family antimicrobial peptide